MRLTSFAFAVLVFAVFGNVQRARGAADVQVDDDGVTMLPAFVVAETRLVAGQMKWRYIGHPNFEILVACSDPVATELAARIPVGLQIADLVLPPEVRLRSKVPFGIIVESRKGKSVSMIRSPSDRDISIAAVTIGNSVKAPYSEESHVWLLTSFLEGWLRNGAPKPAAWLYSAVVGVVERMSVVETTKLRIGALRPLGNTLIQTLMPLDRVAQVLGERRFLSDGQSVGRQSTVTAEERRVASYTGTLLVHWALFAEKGKYRDQFWDYYLRSRLKPDAGEALFKECFGYTYADALTLMQAYRSTADEPYIVDFKESLSAPVPPSPIREASSAEVGRMTGEWARVASIEDAAAIVRIAMTRRRPDQLVSDFAEMKTQLLSAAGKAFERGLKNNNSSDPRLNAAAGIFLAQVGRDAEALPLLEEAIKAGVVRPHAYLELARIRLAGARAAPGAGEKLSAAQFVSVMELLRPANEQSDQQEQYYELLVSLWENAAHKPERAELAPLAACARIFTHRTDLTLRSAQLHAALGYAAEARALCETALPFAPDPKIRDELLLLSRSLATTPPESAQVPAR